MERARKAWNAGDYQSTLLALDEVDQAEPEDEQQDEALILRARTLYQMLRYDDMIAILPLAIATLVTPEAVVTARMMLGMAVGRSGNISEGLGILEEAAHGAEGAGVSRTIRAEIAHARGLMYWLCRDYEQALRFALAAEGFDADVTSVRAMQLRGFVAVSQRNFPEALRIFRSAVERYGACRERYDALIDQTFFKFFAGANPSFSKRARKSPRARSTPNSTVGTGLIGLGIFFACSAPSI